MESKFELAKVVDNLDLAKNIKNFNDLLDTPPKGEWVKKHPMIKSKGQALEYLPIDVVEKTFRAIFQVHNIEVRDVKVIFNSISVSLRVHFLHPISGEWQYLDGVGAAACQTKKGAAAMDANAIVGDAVMKALPTAKAYAFKNAVKPLGNIFGASLNDDTEYTAPSIYDEPKEVLPIEDLKTELSKVTNVTELDPLWAKLEKEWAMPSEAADEFKKKAAELKKEAPKSAQNTQKKEAPKTPTTEDGEMTEEKLKDLLRGAKTSDGLNAMYQHLNKEHNLKPFMNLFVQRKNEIINGDS